MDKIKLYGRYERYWHWTQMLFIVVLAVTGFEIHSSFELIGYQQAIIIHNAFGWAYSILLVFTFFWMFISGFYKQILPTTKLFLEQFNFYRIGIMKKQPHPMHKTPENKMNPIQRLTYFGLMWVALPLQVITGFLYMYFNIAKATFGIQSVEFIALFHTLMAFMVITFIIVHMYMITTGKTISTYLKGMVTGEEEVD